MTETVFINGRFLTQPLSGVQRYALELVSSLDALMAPGTEAARGMKIEVLVPRGHRHDTGWRNIAVRAVGRLKGHAWEQIDLAAHARPGTLVNLGGSGPLSHKRSVLAIHDAAIFVHPEHFSRPYRLLHRFLRPRLARRALQLVTVSRFSGDELARYLGVSRDRFRVIGDSAEHILRVTSDPSILSRAGLEPRRFILCVGNQSPNKNMALAVDAFGLMGNSKYRLVLAGGGSQSVFGAVADLGGDGVVRLGRVTDGELRALYEGAALFLFPSRYEGFGVPPLEAMSLGCPVLSSDAPAMKEILGDEARFFRNGDIADLLRALRDSLAAIEAGDWPVEAARRRAAAYSWPENARSLLQMLQPSPAKAPAYAH